MYLITFERPLMGIMAIMGGLFVEITNRAVGVRWGVENCQNPLNALVEEIQQFKKCHRELFLNPILSIML